RMLGDQEANPVADLARLARPGKLRPRLAKFAKPPPAGFGTYLSGLGEPAVEQRRRGAVGVALSRAYLLQQILLTLQQTRQRARAGESQELLLAAPRALP